MRISVHIFCRVSEQRMKRDPVHLMQLTGFKVANASLHIEFQHKDMETIRFYSFGFYIAVYRRGLLCISSLFSLLLIE